VSNKAKAVITEPDGKGYIDVGTTAFVKLSMMMGALQESEQALEIAVMRQRQAQASFLGYLGEVLEAREIQIPEGYAPAGLSPDRRMVLIEKRQDPKMPPQAQPVVAGPRLLEQKD
jgi:hypothetical protein